MSSPNATWNSSIRLGGLRRFAVAITVLNVLGHTWFGFEQAWIHPFAALATTYSLALMFELVDALAGRRRPQFIGGVLSFVDFLLPAHITGLAVAMLLYPGDRIMPIVFAGTVAMTSKAVLRLDISGRSRHMFNPSNLGIAITLLLFPWVGIAPPYQFTENLGSVGDWVLPSIIICSGTFLNWRFTKRLPLILAWLSVFALQAVIRGLVFDTPIAAGLMPMTGMAFVLFSFYMVTDPPTTPHSTSGQLVFGAAVAATYCLLMIMEIVFGLFFSLAIVSTLRAMLLLTGHAVSTTRQKIPAEASAEETSLPTTVPAPVQRSGSTTV